MGSVLDVFNRVIVLRLVEAWPTAMGVKLGIRNKQKCIAATAVVASLTLFLKEFTGVRTLGAAPSKHVVFELAELLFPLFVGFIDFVPQLLSS